MDVAATLAYLADLAARHTGVVTALVADADTFKAPGEAGFPLVLVEHDPLLEEENEGADNYTVAVHFLACHTRTQAGPQPALLAQMQRLATEYLQQLTREQVVQRVGKAAAVPLINNATGRLASGWRYEFKVLAPNDLDRRTNPGKFAPYVPPPA